MTANPFQGWVLPLRSWLLDDDGAGPLPGITRTPVVSSGFGLRPRNVYSGGWHLGADWSMPWRPGDPIGGTCAVTRVTAGRRFGFVTPRNTLVLACGPGEIVQSAQNSRGWGVVIHHGNTVLTWYQHLRFWDPKLDGVFQLPVPKVGQVVKAGDVLGLAGFDTADQKKSGREGFRHLHWAWLFASRTYRATTKYHDLGRTLGLGFRAIALDPERYTPLLRQVSTSEAIQW